MRRFLLAMLLLIGVLIGFASYCLAVTYWLRNYQTGVYERHWGEACLDTTGLLLYTLLGIRFAVSRVNLR